MELVIVAWISATRILMTELSFLVLTTGTLLVFAFLLTLFEAYVAWAQIAIQKVLNLALSGLPEDRSSSVDHEILPNLIETSG